MTRNLLLVPLSALLIQDPGWIESARRACDADEAGRRSIRIELAATEDPKAAGVIRAVRASLLPGRDTRGLAGYLESVGNPGDDRRGLEKALSNGAWLVALAHHDRLLNSSTMPQADDRLGLERLEDGVWATREGGEFLWLGSTQDPDKLRRVAAKVKSPRARYWAVVETIREHPEHASRLKKLLKSIRREFPDHVEALTDAVTALKPCKSCRGKRRLECFSCHGKKKRIVVCPQCRGEGQIDWDPKIEKPTQRQLRDMAYGIQTGKSYCPSCLGKDDVKQRVVACTACSETGQIECQRCRWSRPSLETLGRIEPCTNCDGTGSMFNSIRHPCEFCCGVGGFLVLHSAPEARLGPFK